MPLERSTMENYADCNNMQQSHALKHMVKEIVSKNIYWILAAKIFREPLEWMLAYNFHM